MKIIKELAILSVLLCVFICCFRIHDVHAKTKPDKPVISANILENGTDVKITINETNGAQGYMIFMKAPEKTKYIKIKNLKKDGTKKRTYTIKGLSEGEYSFKVKSYFKKDGKNVYSAYSANLYVTLERKNTNTLTANDFSKAKVGDIIIFGSYEQNNNKKDGKEPIEWIVLSNDGDSLYVLSKYALDCVSYLNDYYGTTWETSYIRSWLKYTFYPSAFEATEKERILDTSLINGDNKLYGTDGGNDTVDKVFLPSLSDMTNPEYGFWSEKTSENTDYMINRRCSPTEYAKKQGIETGSYYKTSDGDESCYIVSRTM